MAIKGFKKPIRIQYTWVTCPVCKKQVLEKSMLNGNTWEQTNSCMDCRAEQYGTLSNMVWEHEKQNNIQ